MSKAWEWYLEKLDTRSAMADYPYCKPREILKDLIQPKEYDTNGFPKKESIKFWTEFPRHFFGVKIQ